MNLSPEAVAAVLGAVVGAFIGAVSSFLVTMQRHTMVKRQELWGKHLNALVKLERRLNLCFEIAVSNRTYVQKFIEFGIALKLNRQGNGLYFGRFDLFPEFHDIALDLQNIDLINRIFILDIKHKRLNYDLQIVDSAYDDIKRWRMSSTLAPLDYASLTTELSEGSRGILGTMNLLDEALVKATATTRVMLEHDRPCPIWQFYRMPSSYKPQPSELANETLKVTEEIEVVRRQSRAEIDSILPTP